MNFRDFRPATKGDLDRMEKRIMAKLDPISASLGRLEKAEADELAAISAALKDNPTGADVSALADRIDAVAASLTAETSTLTPPAPTPVP